ncbi:MAG: PAS domain-containing protein, partial [Desulfobacteraceae bacterium]|nr:PAS domain-containing protein [Desulfobacteraceae bacterium]
MTKKTWDKIFLTFLILILFAYSTIAMPADTQSIKNIKFSHITNEEGLTHHETLFVMQDTQGFMWFGTKHGLNKYDGMSIIPYFHDHDSNNLNSLVGNFAHWIHEDTSGALWIATWGDGISKYDPELDKFTNYQHEKGNPQSIASNNVWSLFVDSKGFVWAATDNGLSKLNPKTKKFVHYQHNPKNQNSLSHNTISRVKEDDQGIFWISTYGGGLNRFDPETETFTNYKHIQGNPKSLSNNNLWGVFIDSRKQIWIGSEKGLNRFDPDTETFTSYQHDKTDPNSLSSNTITFIHENRSGMLWLGTFGGGLNRFDPGQETFVHFRHNTKDPYSLSNDIIMSIYEDTAGAVWVATYGGIDKYDPEEYQFDNYKSDPDNQRSLSNYKVRSIYQDQDESVWIGTSGGGLTQFSKNRDSDVHYLHDNSDPTSVSDNDIWAIDQDKHGDLWIATHGAGLNRFMPAKKIFIRYEHDPNNLNTPACDPLYDLVVDEKREVLWIAAYLSGLDKFDIKTETFTHYPYDPNNPQGIVSNWVTAVFVDSKGCIWVGTEAGLSLFNPEKEEFTNFKHSITDPKSLSSNMIQMIYEDSQNRVWIGTSDGLNRYDRSLHSFERYFRKDALKGNHIAGITEDNYGDLWISTDKGISKFNPQNGTFRNYDQHDGLQGDHFLMHSVHKNDAGELFFGGTNGFNVFNPKELKDNQNIPRIVFTDFRLFNQSVRVGEGSILTQHINQTGQIPLEYDQDVFSLDFTALNYRNSKNNQYAYMMKGFDKNFTYTGSNNRSATYTNLDPGSYTFHVQGSNNDGVWNKKGASIKIIIHPPWWKTNWFKGSMVLLAIGLIFGIIWFKTHSIRKINRQLEKQVLERTRKIEALLENSPVCTKIVDLNSNLQYMSSAGIESIKINDITPYYGKPYPFDFYPESFKKQIIKNIKQVKNNNEIIEQEGLVSDINGDPVWFHSTLVPVMDDKDQIEYIIIVSVDITDRIQAKKALQTIHKSLENKIQKRTADLTKEVAERKQAQEALKNQTHDIEKRIKELNCLYSISNLLENQDISIEELFHKAVNLMPPSWQYPEITCARI